MFDPPGSMMRQPDIRSGLTRRFQGARNAFGTGDVLPDWTFGEGADPQDGGLGERCAPANRKGANPDACHRNQR